MSIDFVILGAQKAATSALQDALRQHPSIYMPRGESAFFEDPEYADRLWETFGPEDPAIKLRGIKRPDNLCRALLIERIAAALPEARFIVVLREPVSRAVSSYVYLERHAHLPVRPLNEGMQACLDAFERQDDTREVEVISYGLYGRYLKCWYTHYPPERFLVLSQKQVSDDPEATYRAVAEHLGVDPAPLLQASAAGKLGRSNVGLYDPDMLAIAQLGHRLKTRPIPGTNRRTPRSILPRAMGTAITRFAELRAEQRGQRRETLSDQVTARLQALYAEDLEVLRSLVPANAIYWQASTA